MPVIEWVTDLENPGPYDTRFGVVAGERRFQLRFDGAQWEATDLRGGPRCVGDYHDGVKWCWDRAVTEGL